MGFCPTLEFTGRLPADPANEVVMSAIMHIIDINIDGGE